MSKGVKSGGKINILALRSAEPFLKVGSINARACSSSAAS